MLDIAPMLSRRWPLRKRILIHLAHCDAALAPRKIEHEDNMKRNRLMTATRRLFLRSGLASAASLALPSTADAQAGWPSKPIRLICPWPPGGATDGVMRALGESLGKVLGATVLIENRPGASGTSGANELLTAKPDGTTLCQMHTGIVRQPQLQKMAFDPLQDFTYVACLTGYTFGIVVRGDSHIRSMKDLVDFAKANPGEFTYGSPGTGTTLHLVMEDFAFKAGVKLLHVPFKGTAEGMQALLGGHIMAHADSTGWAPHVDAGTARLLATFGSKRTRRWPQVATLQELGYDTVSDSPYGIGGPRSMDAAVTRTLQNAFRKTLEDPAVLSVLDKYDQPMIYMGSDEYDRWMRRQFVEEKVMLERIGLVHKP
jgi:tripartite-type tricarboxylate transporter receptor subunit TctC